MHTMNKVCRDASGDRTKEKGRGRMRQQRLRMRALAWACPTDLNNDVFTRVAALNVATNKFLLFFWHPLHDDIMVSGVYLSPAYC